MNRRKKKFDQSCCNKHCWGNPVPHHKLRKCCGLGGCGPHGCNCYCGVSCHGPLCNCSKEYGYFLCHPESQYPYTQPDYDGAAGLPKLKDQCCNCPPYFKEGFPLIMGCRPKKCGMCNGSGLRLKESHCPARLEALEEAERTKKCFKRVKKSCGGCDDPGCETCEQRMFDILLETFLKAKREANKSPNAEK